MKKTMMTLASPIKREPRDRIQLAKPGKFVHKKFGEFELTRDVFESFIDNFHLMKEPEIPIDYNHKFEEAGGWIKGLEVGEDGMLYGTGVEWTPQAAEQISSGQYKYLSMAFSGQGTDPKGVDIGPMLIAVSLTNIPFLRGLEPVSIELEDGEEEASQVYGLEVEDNEIVKFQASAARKEIVASQFAYVDEKGAAHLPIHDEVSVRASMSALEAYGMDEAAKKKAARKIAGRARRMKVEVQKDFAKKWDLDLQDEVVPTTTTVVQIPANTSTTGSGVVNVSLSITSPTSEEGDAVKPTPPTTTGNSQEDEGDAMLEGKIREVLKLSEKESIEDALAAVQKTRELISGQGENAVVTYFDYTMEREKSIKLERSVAEKDVEIAKLKEEHTKELRRRDAEQVVSKAVAEGRITLQMKRDWALDMAVRSTDEFNRVLASMPRMVTVKAAGSDEEAVVMSAASQFSNEIDKLREEYRKKDPNKVPDVRALQVEVASRDPKLYNEYLEEVRIR